MNKVALVGRLTAEPSFKTFGETMVSEFTIAVNRKKKDEADFIRVKAFGKLAELTADYLKKGSMAGVDGRIQTGSYADKEGKKVYTTEVIAENVDFLSPKSVMKEVDEPSPF